MTRSKPSGQKIVVIRDVFLGLSASICLILMALYFLWSALQGQYGWFSQETARLRIEGLQTHTARLEREINNLKQQIDGLSGQEIRLNLLDERIRTNLGHLRADEVILLPQ